MPKYSYKPLPIIPGTHSIRLVTIHPGRVHDDIVISLHNVRLSSTQDRPRFEALSYVWGSKKNPKNVYVGTTDKTRLRVTSNLKLALTHLRYPDEDRVMWVDALCIDQSNDEEKGSQVALMGLLFQRAKRVVVWLGQEKNESDIAMKFLENIGSQIDVRWGGIHRIPSPAADVEDVDRNIADASFDLPMDKTQSLAVAQLLHRTWFDRLWIRQEIFVAEDQAVVCCGHYQMDWVPFRKALRLLYSKRPTPGTSTKKIQSRLAVIGGLVFQLRWTDILAMRRTFENAVCLDPGDRIYGVRALLHPDQQGLCGLPDYTISNEDLYQRTAQRFIEAYPDGLTILRHCELPNARCLQLRFGPSWVPDWSRKASSRWLHESRASSQIGGCFQFPRPGTLRVLGVSPVTICETQPMPKFDARDWDPGVCFLHEAFDSAIEYLEYPTGGSCLQ